MNSYMDNFSKISQLTALCSWRRAKINKGSSWSDGNLNLLNVLKIIFHSLSTWWQLSYSQLLWHHTGDGKLIIGVLWNSYLSTCVDLCSYAFDLTKKVPTGWSVSCTSKQRSIQSLMQKWFFQEGRDAAQAKTRPCMARQSVMMICYKVVWLFT